MRSKKAWIVLALIAAVCIAVPVVLHRQKQRIEPAQAQTQPPESEWTYELPSIQYDEPEETAESGEDTLTISFVGDCMFASNHGKSAAGSFNRMAQTQPPEYFLKHFIPLFTSDDFTIANCEGVLSDSELTEKEVTTEIAFWFKGPTKNADIFRVSGVDLASVVNNHSHDFGQQGSDDTEKALKAVGVLPGRRDTVTYTTVKGIKLGIFCCSLYSYDYIYDILDKLREMQRENCGLKILYFHGGIENQTVPENWKIRACRELADAGADIIVGSHPHVLQPMEVWGDTPILYSMGNFCFGGNIRPPKNTVVYQAVYTLRDGAIAGREDVLIPCRTYSGSTNNYQPYIVTDNAVKREILNFLHSPVVETTTTRVSETTRANVTETTAQAVSETKAEEVPEPVTEAVEAVSETKVEQE